ncbi:hypothetical protein BST61_g11293 [Cercospora zeina]
MSLVQIQLPEHNSKVGTMAHADEDDWRSCEDVRERRRMQNRLSQRNRRTILRSRKATADSTQNQQHKFKFVQPYTNIVNKPKPICNDKRGTTTEPKPSLNRNTSPAANSKSSDTCSPGGVCVNDADHSPIKQQWNVPIANDGSSQSPQETLFTIDDLTQVPDMDIGGHMAHFFLPTLETTWVDGGSMFPPLDGTVSQSDHGWTSDESSTYSISTSWARENLDAPRPSSAQRINSLDWKDTSDIEMSRSEPSRPSCEHLSGYTALHVAAYHGHLSIVQMLLTNGDNAAMPVDLLNNRHQTALHIACAQGHEALAQFLLDHGADPLVWNSHGQTVLHSAVSTGRAAIVRLLLNAMPDRNMPDQEGRTALHTAVAMGNAEIVRLLLDYGMDRNARILPTIPGL